MKTKLIDISNEDYHSIQIEESYSSSDLKKLVNGSIDDLKLSKLESTTTPAVRLGSVFHKYTLEPDTFYEEFAVMPVFEPTEIDKKTNMVKEKTSGWKNTNDYKEQKKCFEFVNLSKTIIEEEDFAKIKSMKIAIEKSPFAELVFRSNCHYEKAIFNTLGKSGINARIKADVINLDERYILDLKSANDISVDGFGKAIWTMNYDLQEVFYKSVARNEFGFDFNFYFLAVKNEKPFNVALYKLSDKRIEQGTEKIKKGIEKIKSYQLEGISKHESETKLVVI